MTKKYSLWCTDIAPKTRCLREFCNFLSNLTQLSLKLNPQLTLFKMKTTFSANSYMENYIKIGTCLGNKSFLILVGFHKVFSQFPDTCFSCYRPFSTEYKTSPLNILICPFLALFQTTRQIPLQLCISQGFSENVTLISMDLCQQHQEHSEYLF